ncbi:amidohydrolase family protein, partial [Mycobacterium tuberculosis]|nr:amidohydrolase family protein [Mycobacterium tuberculosis]
TLARVPDRLRGVVVLPPTVPDAVLGRLHAAGVRGVRINRRNPGGLSLEDAAAFAARLAPLGWHIQLQVQLSADLALAPLVRSSPVPI